MSEGWVRVSPPRFMRAMYPNARAWQKDTDDGFLEVFRTVEDIDGRWLTHLSIAHKTMDNTPGRNPTWEEQRDAVWEFAPHRTMHSIIPADKEEYVNIHSTTFHWWELGDEP